MKSLKFLCSVIVLAASVSTYAQQEIIIVDRKDFKQDRTRKSKPVKLNDNNQEIKFAPFNMLAGEINFGYERQVSHKGSVDIELGPTISNIRFGGNSHFIDPSSNNQVENSALGFIAAIGYRYYPLDETQAMNRFYVSPVVKYKLMNTVYKDPLGNFSDIERGGDSKLNFYFNFGVQTWLSKSFSMDLYFGFGIGYHTETWYNLNSEFVDNAFQYSWTENYDSRAVYVGNIGLKVGIGSKTKSN